VGWFDGRRARKRYEAGCDALARGDYAVAIRDLSEAVAYRPEWVEAQHDFGIALMAAADFGRRNRDPDTQAEHVQELATEAAKAFNAVLRLRPEFPEAHNNRGRALVKLDRLPEAEEEFRISLRQRPDYAPAAANLTWIRTQIELLVDTDAEGYDHPLARETREHVLQQD
jgi:tetratricopeptide (TPR) repeat protein